MIYILDFVRRTARALCLLPAIFALASWSMPASAQDWPDRPVHLIVSFGAGTASDIMARMIANDLQQQFKKPFIVENKPGADGLIGTEYVARSKPDGYTLLLSSGTIQSINPHLYKKLPFDPIADFSPMGLLCTLPYMLTINAKLPAKNLKEFMAYAKQNAGKISYAYSNGPGQVGGELLAKALGVKFIAVPYKSSPQAMTDVQGGHESFMFTDVSSSKPFIQSGGLRPLAIASTSRSTLLPNLPTMEEASGLKHFDMITWVGVSGPAGVPEGIVAKVNSGINKMLSRPNVVKTLADLGAEKGGGTPDQFKAFMKQQLDLWGKKVKEANIPLK
ncbi:Bug family tripartite tricarboxylate transporter substrate binding protein [Candidimonas nitroreducens]|nr:tripartite tricarboxylate transporter substrate binding protein [Candidimonas nitroreducens]